MKSLLAILLFTLCMPLAGQTTFEDLNFEPDSITAPYKPAGKNFAFIRSKRGSSGVSKTPLADAILTAEVTEIVLVFSEIDPSAITERDEANRERWENLLKTYPDLFQFSTTYKNLCQCNSRGDSASFKKTQGFYVYVNGDLPKVAAEPVAAVTPPAEPAKVAKTEPKKTEEPAPVKPLKTAEKEVAIADRTEVKPKEPAPVVKETPPVAKEAPPVAKETPAVVKEAPAAVKEKPAVVASEEKEEPATPVTPVAKEAPVKKATTAAAKPRRAKDAKACRPPCYGSGDEDLNAFFKDNIPLTKKQRRKAKNWIGNVRLQINFDGAIKKVFVTGANEEFNLQLQEVLKSMNNWNAAVKGGVTIKAEVRFTVKYDSDTKSMKPFDMVMNPRPTPKCVCVSDSELFAD